ncbi:hypothetical protein H4R21_000661 [Coemansia helicoidea]|uniref:Uncharacterized protein n=1 Tax=Coemansia helicoidea TaxID=1286919 RepID=A0ACC1LGA1_9FUNG|nr:hypothetical protein H4R21_000661 [Coemansia helicoidea]
MKLLAATAFLLAGLAPAADCYHIYKATQVNCRSSPSTSGKVVRTYTASDDISLTCQTSGQTVSGNSLWDKTTDGCFVADYYLKTGSTGYVVGKCDSGGGSSNVPGPMGNDYPYSGKCSGVDPWNYYRCQCTSFVAWRINKRLGIAFSNQFKGTNWGNANTWDDAARRTGVLINSSPAVGCIAQTNAGSFGHVAWVAKVSGDSVTVEEYNYAHKEAYGTRTVPKSTFQYIHLQA